MATLYRYTEAAYSAALALKPERGAEVLHSNRSAARLAQGEARWMAALDDALATKRMAPAWFRAYSRACDVYLAMGRRDHALEAMETALALQPSLMGDTVFMCKFKDLRSSKRERSMPSSVVEQEQQHEEQEEEQEEEQPKERAAREGTMTAGPAAEEAMITMRMRDASARAIVGASTERYFRW
jgi:tetratricopeptide (TPR) repeat protein